MIRSAGMTGVSGDGPLAACGAPSRAVRVTLIYLALGAVWIVVTDQLVGGWFDEQSAVVAAGTVKGLLYVGTTGILVYALARRAVQQAGQAVLTAQLAETRKLLETVLANLGDVVMIIDPATRTVRACNSAVTPMFGYEVSEVLGRCTDMLHQDRDAFERFGRIGEPVLERDRVFRCHYRMKRKDGAAIETENTVIVLDDGLGGQRGVVSIVRDITGRVRAEEALRESEERYRLLAENTRDVIWALNIDLEFTYVNPAIVRLLGCERSEILGTHLSRYCSEKVFNEIKRIIGEQVATGPEGEGVVLRTRLRHKDGSERHVEVSGRVIFDEQCHPLAVQGTTRDITERLALEARVRQSQRLEAVGTLAGGVAHEINSPIMGITGYADLIADVSGERSRIGRFAAEIKTETERVHRILRDLLDFARTEQASDPRHVRLGQVVDGTVSLIETLLRHDHITLDVNIPETLPDLLCRPRQIQQVILNLMTNARDALNRGCRGAGENKRIALRAGVVDRDGGRWIRLSIEDHGDGMSDEVREKMFDPFFTSKPDGEGTGLGLSVVYGIVQEHGGDITVDTEPGRGTTVHIDLPATPAPS